MEFHAAKFKENIASLDADFFDRLDAIGRESGAKHVDARSVGVAEVGEHFVRRGFEPLLITEARLKRHAKLPGCKSECNGQQGAGLHALAVVRIAEFDRAQWQA